MRQIRKYFKYIIFLTVYITFLSLSFYLGMKYQLQHPTYIYLERKIPVTSPIVTVKYPSPKSDLGGEWIKQEGKISEIKFSVEYPKSWKLDINEGDKTRDDDNQYIFKPLGEDMFDLFVNISTIGSGGPDSTCIKRSYQSGLWNYCVEVQPRRWQNKEYRFRSAVLDLNNSNVIIRTYFPEDYAKDYEKVLFKMLKSFQLLP